MLDWKTYIAFVALLISSGSYINSCHATKIAEETAAANREPKISLTNLQLKSGSNPVVTYDLKNYGQAKAGALGIVPIVITPRSHRADETQATATMVLNPGEQVSRTYVFFPFLSFQGYIPQGDEFSSEDVKSGKVPIRLHFDIAYRDSDDRVQHKCVAFKFEVATQQFDRDSDCPPMWSDKSNPW